MLIHFQDHPLQLLPQGAAYDAQRGLLFVSDLHLGKAAVFRDAGLAVPEGPDENILRRLDLLLQSTPAKTLVVLGDVFHARSPGTQQAVDLLARWRADHPSVKWQVVPGNHDVRVPWADWLPDAEVLREDDTLGPWRVCHHPPEDTMSQPTLCGHLHPGVALGSPGVRKLRMPCFWQRRGSLIFPAFGDFTGLRLIRREADDRVWVSIKDQIAEVPCL